MSSDIDEQLIAQIVFNDQGLDKALGSVLGSVWAAGRQESFLQSLSNFAQAKDAEIEAACRDNHQHFVRSIEDLYSVRTAVARLKERSAVLETELSGSGRLLYDTRRELLEAQKMFHNFSRAEFGVAECLKTLNMAQRAALQIKDAQYDDALGLIEELERTQLRLIEGYAFAAKVRAWIPGQLDVITKRANSGLTDWLTEIRGASEAIGRKALAQTQARLERGGGDATEDAVALREQAAISMEGLLGTLYLYELMGKRGQFVAVLAESRKKQLDLILETQATSMRDPELRAFQAAMEQLAGFFTFEFYLTQLPQDIYSLPYVETLWETTVARIAETVGEGAGMDHPHQQDFLLKIKWALVFFLGAVQAYPYSGARLYECIDGLFYRFLEILKEQSVRSIEGAIAADDLAMRPIARTDDDRALAASLQCLDGFPLDEQTVFPFSPSVAAVFSEIQLFIEDFHVFLQGVQQHSGELDELARKAVDSYLLRETNRCYLERAEQTQSLRDLAAIYANLGALASMTADVARLLAGSRLRLVRLGALKMFAAARLRLMALMQARVEGEAQRFLDAHRRLDRAPAGAPPGPSLPIQELAGLLGSSRDLLAGMLEPEAAASVLGAAAAHVVGSLTGTLCDPAAPSMNLEYVEGFSADVAHLVPLFAPAEAAAFAELQEILALALSPSCHEYMDPIARQQKYAHLRPDLVVPFLTRVEPQASSKRMSIEDLIMLLGKQQVSEK